MKNTLTQETLDRIAAALQAAERKPNDKITTASALDALMPFVFEKLEAGWTKLAVRELLGEQGFPVTETTFRNALNRYLDQHAPAGKSASPGKSIRRRAAKPAAVSVGVGSTVMNSGKGTVAPQPAADATVTAPQAERPAPASALQSAPPTAAPARKIGTTTNPRFLEN